jgi:hypothetical protein
VKHGFAVFGLIEYGTVVIGDGGNFDLGID